MKIKSLTIENFLAVGTIYNLNLDEKGLVLIQGDNQDDTSQSSNGAGKSTIAEALCWALYGETARGETGDSVINRVEGKNTRVEVIIEEETGELYRISRHRKHKTHKNMLRLEIFDSSDGSWDDYTKGTDKLTQEVVNKVVGCSHEVFASAIYAGQEAMPDLPGMTDKQLKVLVEEAAGISELQQAHEIAKSKMQAAISDNRTAATNAAFVSGLIDSCQDAISGTKDLALRFDTDNKLAVEVMELEIREAEKLIDPDLALKIEQRMAEVTGDIAAHKTGIKGSEAESQQEALLAKTATQKAIGLDRAERDASQALLAAQKAKHVLDHVDAKIGSSCGECGHVIEAADLTGAKEAAKKAALDKAREAKQLKEQVEIARERATSAAAELEKFRASMTDVSASASAISELSIKLFKLSEALDKERRKVIELDSRKKALDTKKKDVNPYQALLLAQQSELSKLEDKLADAKESAEKAEQAALIAEAAVKVFGPAGVRAHILDTVTPHLNSRTSHYLAALSDGNITAVWNTIGMTAKGELREKFAIEVKSATGAETFKGLSGGEKRKVRLACAMALQDLVSSRASKPIKIFIADEIDHALDPAGLERLMTILEEKSHDKGTVLVISHNDLKDWIRNSVTIVKKGGKSYLEPTSCL